MITTKTAEEKVTDYIDSMCRIFSDSLDHKIEKWGYKYRAGEYGERKYSRVMTRSDMKPFLMTVPGVVDVAVSESTSQLPIIVQVDPIYKGRFNDFYLDELKRDISISLLRSLPVGVVYSVSLVTVPVSHLHKE